jgi:hypothetical protein
MIRFMTNEDRTKLTVKPIENQLEKRIKRLESNIIATAKAYRQIGMIQVSQDIEVLVN